MVSSDPIYCERCLWFKPQSSFENRSKCLRYPPPRPFVEKSDWCGEWKPLDDMPVPKEFVAVKGSTTLMFCPFCGANDVEVISIDTDVDVVQCPVCLAEGPRSPDKSSEEEAIAAWNWR